MWVILMRIWCISIFIILLIRKGCEWIFFQFHIDERTNTVHMFLQVQGCSGTYISWNHKFFSIICYHDHDFWDAIFWKCNVLRIRSVLPIASSSLGGRMFYIDCVKFIQQRLLPFHMFEATVYISLLPTSKFFIL